MTSSLLLFIQITLLVLFSLTRASRANVDLIDPNTELSINLSADELPSLYDGIDEIEMEMAGGDVSVSGGRRSLFWHRMRYYISYGALAANRVPCPPRSGRSYYTHNCWGASGQVHPYTRGCSAITRCRR